MHAHNVQLDSHCQTLSQMCAVIIKAHHTHKWRSSWEHTANNINTLSTTHTFVCPPIHLMERPRVFSTLWGCLCVVCVVVSLLPLHQLEILDTTADVIALAMAVTTSPTWMVPASWREHNTYCDWDQRTIGIVSIAHYNHSQIHIVLQTTIRSHTKVCCSNCICIPLHILYTHKSGKP